MKWRIRNIAQCSGCHQVRRCLARRLGVDSRATAQLPFLLIILPPTTTSATTFTVIELLLTYLCHLQIASTLESSCFAHQAPIYTNDRNAQNIAQSSRSNRSTQQTYPNVLSSKNSHPHILDILQTSTTLPFMLGHTLTCPASSWP